MFSKVAVFLLTFLLILSPQAIGSASSPDDVGVSVELRNVAPGGAGDDQVRLHLAIQLHNQSGDILKDVTVDAALSGLEFEMAAHQGELIDGHVIRWHLKNIGRSGKPVLNFWVRSPLTCEGGLTGQVDVTVLGAVGEVLGTGYLSLDGIEVQLPPGRVPQCPPGDPEDPAPPTDPEDPAPPTDPEDPAPPADPEDPAPPAGPEDPAPPTDPEDPAPPTDPEDPAPPADPEDPAPPTDPEDPAPPADPDDPEQEDPAKGELPFTGISFPVIGAGALLTAAGWLLLRRAARRNPAGA